MRLLTITAFAQGLANFGLALYLGRKLGLGGITLALLLVVLPQTYLLWRKIGRFFEFSVLDLLARNIVRCLLPLLVASALSLGVHSLVTIRHKHLLPFFAEAFAFVLTYAVLAYYVALVPQDKEDVRRYLAWFTSPFGRTAKEGQIHG